MMFWIAGSLLVLLLAALWWRAWRAPGRANVPAEHAPEFAPDEVDDEIRGVFITEMRNEIGGLRRNLPRWRTLPTDLDRAVPLRRAFHTLKGGGRLVGAVAIGDFCAAIERLLLCVIEKEVAADPPVIEVVSRAVAVLPGLLAEFSGERAAGVDVRALARTAEQLASPARTATASSRRPAPPRGAVGNRPDSAR
jgi:chemotaxis protein histidine kinase CheA